MVPAVYDPASSCDDMPEFCAWTPVSAEGLGLREIRLYWRGTYTDGARFTLAFPADWSIYRIEFCDGITPVVVGGPGEPIELDFGQCRENDPVKLGRVILNVRSHGYLFAENEAVRVCSFPQFQKTIGHGAVELGLTCDIAAVIACEFCGYSRMSMSPDRFERVFLAGNAGSDTLFAPQRQPCFLSGTCTESITPCLGDPWSEVAWVTLIDLGDPDPDRRFRAEYGVQTFPPGRYQGAIRLEEGGCCAGDCLALDIQVITQVGENRQPVARIRPLGAEISPVQFNGIGSFDLDGSPLTYHWDFGDGSTSTVPAPLHAFATIGTAIVTLRVSDGSLESTPDSLELELIPQAPTGIGDTPSSVDPGAAGMVIEAPNPFVPGEGALSVKLSTASRIRVQLFDVSGRSVGILAEGDFPPGSHAVTWENVGRSHRVQPGVYVIRVTDAQGNSAAQKIVVLK